MGKWRQGLKIDLGNNVARQHSLTSNKNFTQPNHPLQEKFAKSAYFHNFASLPGEQMSTLWANGDMGLKSTFGQQNSSQHSLTSNKNFTQLNHPIQEQIR